MMQMFHEASSFNGNLTGWDMRGVRHLTRMFAHATALRGRGLEDWEIVQARHMSKATFRKGPCPAIGLHQRTIRPQVGVLEVPPPVARSRYLRGRQRRRLEVTGLNSDSIRLYRIDDVPCPDGTASGSSCQTAYGSFSVTAENEKDPEGLSNAYSDALQKAIDDGNNAANQT